MSPFKELYRRKCTTLIRWDNLVDRLMMGPKMLQEMEKMAKRVEEKLKRPKTDKKATQI
jgi:hypothetical protein